MCIRDRIKVEGHGIVTLLAKRALENVASMFREEHRIEEDTLTIANGVVGAYPNVFLEVSESELSELVSLIRQLRSEADYSALLDRFGVRRTDARFWSVSDQIRADYRRAEPLTAGVLDYSRYDNR